MAKQLFSAVRQILWNWTTTTATKIPFQSLYNQLLKRKFPVVSLRRRRQENNYKCSAYGEKCRWHSYGVFAFKANTIRHIEKKKLNLEEYKKRRKTVTPSNSNSQSSSPISSTCSSPAIEDENQKIVKYQEKLKKMAEGVLTAAPAPEKKTAISTLSVPLLNPNSLALSSGSQSPLPQIEVPSKKENEAAATGLPFFVTVPPRVPPNLERKVLVSIGVNTDMKSFKYKDSLTPVEKLQEIKPDLIFF